MSDRRPPILLAHSYFLEYDPKQARRMKPYPPLGTLLAAARLREEGYRVEVFDAMLAPGVEAFEAAVRELRPPIVGIFEDNFNFLTKMCTTRMREAAHRMIRCARAAGARVAVNGSDAIDRPASYLEAGADAVILGEVEETATELFAAWCRDADADPAGVTGLALPASRSSPATGLRRTPPRGFLSDLDALPFPAWDLVDVEAYRRAWTDAHGRFSWNAVTSRGCPYGCNWCAKPVFGRRYAQRGPELVAEEMARLKETVAPDHVWFADDIFGLTARWIDRFADEVEVRDARIPFLMQSRANLMRGHTVEALGRAGAEEVWLGVESGSQRILDAMDKGTTVDEVREATRALRGEGIRCGWFIQLGYRGEEWHDILETRELIRAERPDEIGVSVSYPLPGTRFYRMVEHELGPKRNWTDSDDLDMMFQGTFETDVYRKVRTLLHDEVDAGPDPTPAVTRSFERRWAALEEEAHRRRQSA